MCYVKRIIVSTEKNYWMIYQIYRKIVDEQPMLRVFYKMSDGTTEEKYITDPKNLCLQPDA